VCLYVIITLLHDLTLLRCKTCAIDIGSLKATYLLTYLLTYLVSWWASRLPVTGRGSTVIRFRQSVVIGALHRPVNSHAFRVRLTHSRLISRSHTEDLKSHALLNAIGNIFFTNIIFASRFLKIPKYLQNIFFHVDGCQDSHC